MKNLLIILLLGISQQTFALCSNCKAVVENNGNEWGNGLNDGILILMIVPYILLIGIVLLAFNGKIRQGLKNFVNS